MDLNKIEQGVRLILEGAGEDVSRPGLLETPARVARMYEEILQGNKCDPKELFVKDFGENHREMVIVKDIPLYSVCEHHLMPFFGNAAIGYLPGKDGRICGISKLARLVDTFAQRLQVQERLTTQVAETLMNEIEAQGVICVIEAEHMCMSMRGVKKAGAITKTSAVRGAFDKSVKTRAEAFALLQS